MVFGFNALDSRTFVNLNFMLSQMQSFIKKASVCLPSVPLRLFLHLQIQSRKSSKCSSFCLHIVTNLGNWRRFFIQFGFQSNELSMHSWISYRIKHQSWQRATKMKIATRIHKSICKIFDDETNDTHSNSPIQTPKIAYTHTHAQRELEYFAKHHTYFVWSDAITSQSTIIQYCNASHRIASNKWREKYFTTKSF